MDDILPRATRLLQPFMSEERRGTWLALAFHGSNRAILDGISQRGSNSDFTVRCVSQLLDRGRVGSRHALSLLLEAVRGDAGDELQERFEQLISELDQPQGAQPMPDSSTILFLAASPDDQQRLALDHEARAIRERIRAAAHRDTLVFRTEWAVQPRDLLQYLNEYRPQAVHFSGHGTGSEILLNDSSGLAKPVSGETLRELFALHRETVRLVVLNACFSREQAQAIVGEIDCAVGMNREIGDEAAIVFAAAFYGKLGFRASVAKAFAEGCVALRLEGIAEHRTPELLVRHGVDADRLFLVGATANPR